MADFDVMHLPAEYLSDGETMTACEEIVGPGEHTENVDDATCLDCLRASILPALAQGRREGAEEERARIVAWLHECAAMEDVTPHVALIARSAAREIELRRHHGEDTRYAR